MTSGSDYHLQTGYTRGKTGGKMIDFKNMPVPYTIYPDAPLVHMSKEMVSISRDFFSCLFHSEPQRKETMTLADLESGISHTAGINAVQRTTGGIHYYRIAPSAGALYPVELYLWVRRVEGMEQGLFHYHVPAHGLSRLTKEKTADAGKKEEETPYPDVRFFFTARYFKSAWKYADRAYRYVLLDCGHMVENLLLWAKAKGFQPCLHLDFDDSSVNRFLGLEPEHEFCLACVDIFSRDDQCGKMRSSVFSHQDGPEKNRYTPQQPAPNEEENQAVLDVHANTSVSCKIPSRVPELFDYIPGENEIALSHMQEKEYGKKEFTRALMERRSRRNFVPADVSGNSAEALIMSLFPPAQYRFMPDLHEYLVFPVTALSRVTGWDTGVYWISGKEPESLIPAPASSVIQDAARACLGQNWLKNAGFHFLFASPLKDAENAVGNRFYRYAMIHAGRLGQRVYLAGTALGFGVCGIGAFYDDELAGVFNLPKGVSPLYLVGTGVYKGG